MRKLMIFLLIAIALVFSGCDMICPDEEIVPAEEVIVEEPALDCDGHYFISYRDFQMKDWANCDYFAPAGIYWMNDVDGRIFFLGETGVIEVENEACEDGIGYENIPDPIALFGDCPAFFEWELIVPEPVIEE